MSTLGDWRSCPFKLDASGQETVLHSFTGAPDGASTTASLVRDAAGNLYGTTPNGGESGCGTYGSGCGAVFKVTVPDFSISASPTLLTVTQGSMGISTLTLTPLNGFNQTIMLKCSGAPKNSTCSISPSSVTLDGINPKMATLTISTTMSTPTGTFTLTAIGNSGTLKHTAKIKLMVQ